MIFHDLLIDDHAIITLFLDFVIYIYIFSIKKIVKFFTHFAYFLFY